jgi:hypothetical protein
MRNFFLFLLLINLLAFAYQSWIIEPTVSIAPDFSAQDVAQLLQVEREARPSVVLVQPQEVAATAVVDPQASPTAVVSPAGGQALPAMQTAYQCLRIGPFAREADVEVVQRKLQPLAAEVRRTVEAGRVWLGYWVQTTAYPSRQAAEAARKNLINKDMPDAYIIAEDNEYRVSLGVFRLRASAEEVVDRARRQGFSTRTVERYQPGANFWLLARVAGDRDVVTGGLPNVPGQILRSESVPCPEAVN